MSSTPEGQLYDAGLGCRGTTSPAIRSPAKLGLDASLLVKSKEGTCGMRGHINADTARLIASQKGMLRD